jgi:hypothetical protein
MENEYKIIAYTVGNKHVQEIWEYKTDTFDWQVARASAIELARIWKEESDLEESYDGIMLEMSYGIEGNPEHTFQIDLLTGRRMHSPEITQAL